MIKIIIAVLIAILLVVFIYYQNFSIESEIIKYERPGIRKRRILVVSDLHSRRFGKNNERLIKKAIELKPDIIVFPGDMLDSARDDMNISIDLMNSLAKYAPSFYISGNHERRMKREKYQKYLELLGKTEVQIINDKRIRISDIELIGIESKKNKSDALSVYKSLKIDSFSIVLCHEPEYAYLFDANIIISGHAHGGQFRIFKHGFFAPGQGFFPKYTSGRYDIDNKSLFVSRGLGGKDFRIRLFNRPHLMLIEIN